MRPASLRSGFDRDQLDPVTGIAWNDRPPSRGLSDRHPWNTQQRAIYGLANLARRYARADIEAACEKVLTLSAPSYQALKRLLERVTQAAPTTESADAGPLTQAGDEIRPIDDYQAFFEQHAEAAAPASPPTERNPR